MSKDVKYSGYFQNSVSDDREVTTNIYKVTENISNITETTLNLRDFPKLNNFVFNNNSYFESTNTSAKRHCDLTVFKKNQFFFQKSWAKINQKAFESNNLNFFEKIKINNKKVHLKYLKTSEDSFLSNLK